MDTQPAPLHRHPRDPLAPDPLEARARRLCWLALAGAMLLALYVGSLAWAARELGAGVASSLQPLSATLRDNPAAD
ncbi:MAG: hypothetical protein EPO30_06310 [Lysobacteraceae bacterium]|nr:MAG: hypothetical protein EPO30_06310 [Xanthomonadaceae bacterium]